ncbi:MAG: tetratricopeptide repeat protein [Bacteroidales bacterium]|nr:tetratricopeptide repeat protein [Bacteroidales bacterium]
MGSYRHPYRIIICLAILVLITGCSVEKNTGASRFYHGLTARYNIYFNGYESYKSGIDKINQAHRDDFADFLMVFEYSNPVSAQAGNADMERAIQKASKLITLKSITAKPEKKDNQPARDDDFYNQKEYNRWVDDSYLLISKARFYQRDFVQARSTIAFNNESSSDAEIKTEGNIWLARIHSETGNFSEAARVLGETGDPGSFPSSLQAMYYTTLADILVKQKKYSEAIEPLARAVEAARGKRQKYRHTFLLAQLYGETGQPEKAIASFEEVIKLRPPYEVEFNARIGMATVYDASAGSPAKIRADLTAMTRDEKNREYLDQIYFALGKMAEKEGNMDDAIENYRLAARSGGSASNGRGRAYLALAAHYFDIPDYLNAKNYYDSAVVFLDEQFPDYQLIRTKSQSLSELVTQLETVRKEDSLRRVAAMTDQERSVLISGIIEDLREEERERMSEGGTSDMFNLGQFYENERRFRDNIEQEGQWYFYNQAALTFGRTEFKRRWGERKLEDNWRRQNKRLIQQEGGGGEEGLQEADTSMSVSDPMNPAFYLRELPVNDSLVAISLERTANALYNAGQVYASNFRDIERAAASWTDLLSRFPGHELVPQTYYQLYLLFRENDPSRAETYRQNLLEKFPDSDFAMILTDPDYFRKQREQELMAGRLYEEAYNNYLDGRYPEAAGICDNIIKTTPENTLIPKVRLLKALTLAGIGEERLYRENLSALIKDFPGTKESERAAGLMAALDQEIPELRVEEDIQIASEIYVIEPEEQHVFVLLIENPAFNINQATFDIINYNIDNHATSNFRAVGELIDNKFILLTVSRFATAAAAMEYYRTFDALTIIRNSSPATTKTFIISVRNLETLKNDKDPARYMLFFRQNYLNNDEAK